MAIALTNHQNRGNNGSNLAVMSQHNAQKSKNPLALMSQSKAQESKRNQKTNSSQVKKNASPSKKHSFLFGIYSDFVKSIWKIVTGVFAVETVKGILKDKNFDLAKVIDHILRTDFLISSAAYMFGAWSVRVFDGTKKLFGMAIPKLPSSIAAHGASNIVAKAIGLITNSELLNKESAETGRGKIGIEVAKQIDQLKWTKALKKVNQFYHNHIEGKLSTLFSTIFGVKRSKDEGGKTQTKVNWLHFALANTAIGLSTFFLPKETQVYGMEDFSKSKSFKDIVINGALYFLASTLSRLDCYTFYNVLAMHPQGYGSKEIIQSSVRDRMLPPMLQTIFDIVSGLLNKVIPINGAMLASIVTLPIDIIGAFLSADLVGLAKETRVSSNWTYLANKIWKPVSKVIESIVEPMFNLTLKPMFYRLFFGFFPENLEGKYEPLKDRQLPKSIKDKYSKQNTALLFLESVLSIPTTIYRLLKETSRNTQAS